MTSRIWLAASVVAVLGVAVVDGFWVGPAVRVWQILLQAAILALLAMVGIVWVRHARTARRLAVLNAYAEREIARSRHRQDEGFRTRG